MDPKWTPCETCNCLDGESTYRTWSYKGVLERTRRCPRTMVTDESTQWLFLHRHYKAGFLAVAGGTLDQPSAYLEAMAVIDLMVNQDGAR